MNKKITFLALTAAGVTVANASVISVNFMSGDISKQKTFGSSTGVIDTVAGDWLNMNTSASLTSTNVLGTTVDVTASEAAQYQATAEDAAPDFPDGTDSFLALFSSGLRADTVSSQSVTISDISAFLTAEGASEYRIIAYYKSALDLGSSKDQAFQLRVDANPWKVVSSPDNKTMNYGDTFVQLGNAESNWVEFTGLTGDSVTLEIDRSNSGSRDGLLVGFQIQAVPEPSSTALLGLGGLALILRRRK